MSSFLTRYDEPHVDRGAWRPTAGQAVRGVLTRLLPVAVVLFLVITGFGLLLNGPLTVVDTWDDGINRTVAGRRTPTFNAISTVLSEVGSTMVVIGAAALALLLLLVLTRRWWLAIIPALAVATQAAVFLSVTLVVDRQRPPVDQLDPAPPTSSYPSGHTGATTALYVSLALQACRIRAPALRTVLVVVCVLIPILVGLARIYRGMHHVSDVVAGLVNGTTCALAAWNYLRRPESNRT